MKALLHIGHETEDESEDERRVREELYGHAGHTHVEVIEPDEGGHGGDRGEEREG